MPAPAGIAVQCRVNMETMAADGTARPAGGVLTAFEVPSGTGYRTDSFGYVGYRTSASFDSLLAKVIVHTPSAALPDALAKAGRALAELRVEGVPTNTAFLQAILAHPTVRGRRGDDALRRRPHGRARGRRRPRPGCGSHVAGAPRRPPGARLAGVKVDAVDPLAVLDFGQVRRRPPGAGRAAPRRRRARRAGRHRPPCGPACRARSWQLDVADGDPVGAGQQLLVMEAMKMEHVVAATEPASCASSAWPSATPSSRATRSCSSSRPTSATS